MHISHPQKHVEALQTVWKPNKDFKIKHAQVLTLKQPSVFDPEISKATFFAKEIWLYYSVYCFVTQVKTINREDHSASVTYSEYNSKQCEFLFKNMYSNRYIAASMVRKYYHFGVVFTYEASDMM